MHGGMHAQLAPGARGSLPGEWVQPVAGCPDLEGGLGAAQGWLPGLALGQLLSRLQHHGKHKSSMHGYQELVSQGHLVRWCTSTVETAAYSSRTRASLWHGITYSPNRRGHQHCPAAA
jgi:hypothetical protein